MGSPLPVNIAVVTPQRSANRQPIRKLRQFTSGSFNSLPNGGVILEMQNGHLALQTSLPAKILNVCIRTIVVPFYAKGLTVLLISLLFHILSVPDTLSIYKRIGATHYPREVVRCLLCGK